MITLENSKIFGPMQPADRAAILGIARDRAFAPGQVIFREGDQGDGLYLVREGRVEISARISAETLKTIAQVEPGDIFGEMAVLEDKPRSATATARAQTRVYFLPREDTVRLVETSPALALALLREISQRLRDFNLHYVEEVLQTERLALVGRFTRSIVHDLKNPLNTIGIAAELAGMPGASPQLRQESATRIRNQVERISAMVGEIVEFTQNSHPHTLLGSLDYGTFLEPLLAELRNELSLRSITFNTPSPLPSVSLAFDPKRLRRVLENLVHNAAEALESGGEIHLRVQIDPAEVVTEVEDSGPGISPEIIDRLFEPFATYGKVHGTGLGLSICKRVVEDHRGRITARNQPGHGAVFSFALPRANSTAAPAA